MDTYDVAVIGGGVHGLFSAYAIALRGKKVIVCEQFEFGHLRGSSHGPAKIHHLSFPDPDYVKLAMNALSLWQKIEDEAQVDLIETNGCVDHGSASTISTLVKAMDTHGIASEVLDRSEAKYRWPNLEFDESVVFHPGGGRIYSRATLTALHGLCINLGVEMREFFEVKNMFDDRDGAKILEGERESIKASVVVSCAGAWTGELLEGVLDIPKPKVSQEQYLYFTSRDPGAIWPNIYHHGEVTYYCKEAPGVGIQVGGVRQGTYIERIEDRDFVIDPLVAIQVCDYAEKFMPGLDPHPTSSETCIASFSKNGDFIVDRVGNLVVVQACQQMGFTFSPIIGKYAADLATESQFSQLRFRLP